MRSHEHGKVTRMDERGAAAPAGGTPIVDGERVTFRYHGDQAPELIADFNRWGRSGEPIVLRQERSGVWTHTETLPRDAYIEYLFRVDGRTEEDPLNPRTVEDGVGGRHNFFYMPDAHPPRYELNQPLHGTLTVHEVENPYFLVGERRTVRLYRPAVDQPVPLLVVWDGQDYFARAGLVHQVDALIDGQHMSPVALALSDHAGQARVVEYFTNDATLHYLRETLLPLAQRELPLLSAFDSPGCHGLLGASLGGLMALYGALRMPDVFGTVFSQSGSFGLHPDRVVIRDLVRYLPPTAVRVHLDWGRYEALREPNVAMAALLRERGYRVSTRELPGFHNFTTWARALPHGLKALFPPAGHRAPEITPL